MAYYIISAADARIASRTDSHDLAKP